MSGTVCELVTGTLFNVPAQNLIRAPVSTTFFGEMLQSIAERGRALIDRTHRRGAGEQHSANLIQLCEDLLSRRGEASGVALAREILLRYGELKPGSRIAFFEELASRFGPDPVRLRAAASAWLSVPSETAAANLHRASEPRRLELIRRLNLAPNGTRALVRMREQLMDAMDHRSDLETIDEDFLHLFSSWFNRGFLVLRRIDWSTPARILEKIIRYEAVHEIRDWNDLRARIDSPDRRCYAFFHPALVDEPLIFVEVALTRDIPDAIAPLLAAEREPIRAQEATTAVFYSISNTQRGLAGVSFGNFLIKQVVEDLRRSLPGLKTFVTLSPVPGFAAWLNRERTAEEPELLDPAIRNALAGLDDPAWPEDAEKAEALRRPLLAAAATYFLKAKASSGLPADSVARFHLRNGARLERINFKADVSRQGLDQAHGLMTNYLYDLDQIEKNHEAFAAEGKLIAAAGVRKLMLHSIAARSRG